MEVQPKGNEEDFRQVMKGGASKARKRMALFSETLIGVFFIASCVRFMNRLGRDQ